jgi:cyclophilin family peptidyl-prolyl cis-trans isomerase
MRRFRLLVTASLLAAIASALIVRATAQSPPEAPRITFRTSAGRFTIETYPLDAPLTVAHVVDLVKKGFYNGQRVHRALPGFVVQFGDPQTRDESKRESWGRGAGAASGKPIGAAEIVLKRSHVRGAVGMAHLGEPAEADSQIFITLQPRPDLDGQYAVFAHVIDGEDVPARLRVGDLILSATVDE